MNFNQILPILMSFTDNLYISNNYVSCHVIMHHLINYGAPRLVNFMRTLAVIVLGLEKIPVFLVMLPTLHFTPDPRFPQAKFEGGKGVILPFIHLLFSSKATNQF